MPAGLTVHRLSARTPARAQPVAARLALQALGADLEDALPRSLPPQALLWLRRLQLQAPEAALLRPAPRAWRQGWIAAGRERFDAALAQAARPALGPVPESAPAVLFADAAEMLACLALAAQSGQMDRWWWRGLLGRAWPQWETAWGARPEAQAGAVRLLVRSGQGGAVADWGGLLDAVQRPLAAMSAVDSAVDGPRPLAPGHAVQGTPSTTSQALDVPPVLMPTTAEAPADTERQHSPASTAIERVSSVQALPEPVELLAKPVDVAPAAVFRAVPPATPAEHALPADDLRAPPAPTAPAVPEAASRPRTVQPPRSRSPDFTQPQAVSVDDSPATTERAPDPLSPAPARAPLAGATVLPSGPQPTAAPVFEPEARTAQVAAQLARTADVDRPALARHEPPMPVEDSAITWPWPQAVFSRQAPLLFIVNALLEDGLYPDFTRPRDPGLPVPLWALLAALAGAWRLPADDPLHAALLARCPDWTAPDAMPAAPGAPAGPWPEWLPSYARALRRRLCRRLGLRPAAWPQALTLAHPARLWCSEAECVAEFDLGAHKVAWRLAGLDRDPGWLPSVGCTLRFVFA